MQVKADNFACFFYFVYLIAHHFFQFFHAKKTKNAIIKGFVKTADAHATMDGRK